MSHLPRSLLTPALGAFLPQLTTAGICRIEWSQNATDGTFKYLYRICGIVRRIAAVESLTGPRIRLQGELVAGIATKRWVARSAIVPEEIADAVKAAFADHPPHSTRDRVSVHVDFDLWAIRKSSLALGCYIHCEGRAYVPQPLTALVAQAFSRPVPPAPTLEEL